MLKITHFISDDKFIDNTIDWFDNLKSTTNSYYFYNDNCNSYQYKYIQKEDRINLTSRKELELIFKNSDIVILHSLGVLPYAITSKIPKNIKLVWFSWGYDIYTDIPLIKLKKTFYRITKKYNKRLNTLSLKSFLLRNRNHQRRPKINSEIINAIKRIDYYSGVIPFEYNLLTKLSYFHAERLNYIYAFYGINKITDSSINGPNILINQRASIKGNHFDIINQLSELKLNNKIKIITPLSYGDSIHLTKQITNFGIKKLGSQFTPITNFLSLEKYNLLLNSCGFAVFGFFSQAAIGNIWLCIQKGMKVFFPRDSINYKYFTQMGVIVFTIESDLNQHELTNRLPQNIIKSNQRFFYEQTSYERNMLRLNNLVNTIKDSDII